jgi:hypothetical protein
MNLFKSEYNRRNFFGMVTKSAVGFAVLSSLPGKLFSKTQKKLKKKINIKIHPSAVKRNK